MELALVEALSLSDREQLELVGVVGDEHDSRVGGPAVDRHAERPRVPEREAKRPQARERVASPAVALAAVDEPRVEAERDVVQEEPVVHAADVDPPLVPLERVRERRAGRRGRGRCRGRNGFAFRTARRRRARRARSPPAATAPASRRPPAIPSGTIGRAASDLARIVVRRERVRLDSPPPSLVAKLFGARAPSPPSAG